MSGAGGRSRRPSPVAPDGPAPTAAIARERVKDAYDKAVLDCSRIVSWADDEDGYDLDCLPYYEGRRDALKALLEPEDSSDADETADEFVSHSHIASRHGDACDA